MAFSYRKLQVPHYPDPSTAGRDTRLSELLRLKSDMTSIDDILNIVGDRNNKEYPFFRDGADPDYLVTAATGLHDELFNRKKLWHDYYDFNVSVKTYEL